jgi:hypothetical protein
LLVLDEPGELSPPGIGDRAGQAVVGQHPGHIQVLDDDPVVGLDQLVGHLVQEVSPNIGDVVVMSRQFGGGIVSVV